VERCSSEADLQNKDDGITTEEMEKVRNSNFDKQDI
jgi:hypothetical protein